MWAALLIAQPTETNQGPADGLLALIANLIAAFQDPLKVWWADKSLFLILTCIGAYIMALTLLSVEQGRIREGAERGFAAQVSPRQVNTMFAQEENKFLTRNVHLGLDTHKHHRLPNVLVVGGSGAAKTRSYVGSNILKASTSYVVTDSKQEVLTATSGWLKQNGYEIRVFNLINLEQSDDYNPFHCLWDEEGALKLVNNLIQTTTPRGSHESDPFWTKTEAALPRAIILILFQEAPEYEQNFSMVMWVLEYAEVKGEDGEYVSPLDLLFQVAEQDRPGSVAMRQYKVFKIAVEDICSE